MIYGCGCCGKAVCDDENCPGCVRWRREERGAPADRAGPESEEQEQR